MKNAINAFASLLKKDLCLYGRKILSTLLLLLLLIAGCVTALLSVMGSAIEERDKVDLVLVDKDASSLSKMAINVVKGSDAVGEMFNVESLDTTQEALAGMKDGTYDGAIIFEEDYLSTILDGDSSAVRILLSDSLSASALTILHFAKTGEKLIRVAEYGVMSAQKPLYENYDRSTAYSMLSDMEIKYAFRLLSLPETAFEHTQTAYANSSVGLVEYYILAFLVFLLIVLEVVFFPFTSCDCAPAMLRRIKSYSICNAVIIAEKAFIPFIIRSSMLLFATTAINYFINVDISTASIAYALICIALLSLMMSSLSILLSQTPLGIAMIFALSAVGLFMCGGLIPISMLPYEIISAGGFTPSGLCTKLLSPLLYGTASPISAVIMALMCFILMLAANMFMRRIAKQGGGVA